MTVTNQAELDTLRDVTEIRGSLTIRARYVQPLEPLRHLSILTDSLVIYSCPSLTNFGSLNRLTRIDGDLTIHGNSRLRTVETLSELVSIGGSLEISDNPELQSVIYCGQPTADRPG